MSGHKNFKLLREQIDAIPVRRARVEWLKHAYDVVLEITRLREAQVVTPEAITRAWEIAQECGGRAEQSCGAYLDMVGAYVAALGGNLQLTAVFPDQTITLTLPDQVLSERGIRRERCFDD